MPAAATRVPSEDIATRRPKLSEFVASGMKRSSPSGIQTSPASTHVATKARRTTTEIPTKDGGQNRGCRQPRIAPANIRPGRLAITALSCHHPTQNALATFAAGGGQAVESVRGGESGATGESGIPVLRSVENRFPSHARHLITIAVAHARFPSFPRSVECVDSPTVLSAGPRPRFPETVSGAPHLRGAPRRQHLGESRIRPVRVAALERGPSSARPRPPSRPRGGRLRAFPNLTVESSSPWGPSKRRAGARA